MAEERRIREEKMDEEHREREEARAKARRDRDERDEKERQAREEKEMNDLFASKRIDVSPLKDAKVLFVIGGPGSGKVCLAFFYFEPIKKKWEICQL